MPKAIKRPTISIIMPCYNGSCFLEKTLKSALTQTYLPLEIIVIDDGSTDDSSKIAESFGLPVRVIHQLNQGESVARNRGIQEAQGDYLLFLDADDLLKEDALEQLSYAVNNQRNVVSVMGCAWFESDPESPFMIHIPTQTAFFPELIKGSSPPHCWLVSKELVQQVGGFSSELQQFEDWEFWIRIGLTGAHLKPLSYVGAYYRRHPNSQVKTTPRRDRVRWHCVILQRIIDGMLRNLNLLEECGEALFWEAWTIFQLARIHQLSRHELRPLEDSLEKMAKYGPTSVTRQRFAGLIRLIGFQWADTLRNAVLILNRESRTALRRLKQQEHQ